MKLSHVGIVVKDIDEYLENNVISEASEPVYDALQDANICFIRSASSTHVELIEPRSSKSKVYSFLQQTGGGLHHLCFSVGHRSEVERLIREKGMIKVLGPVRASALPGKDVFFLYTQNRELIELEVHENAAP